MTMRHRLLPKREYIEFAPDMPGIVRVNHQSDYCSGDSPSMLVERKQDGSVSGYCFRCGGSGWTGAGLRHLSTTEIRTRAARRSEDYQTIVGGIAVPDDASGSYSDFPGTARAWLSKAGLTEERIEHENFLWSEEKSCLYIPVRQTGELVGYVQRYMCEGGEKIYRTLKLDNRNFFGYYPKEVDKTTEKVVVVEDVLSGLRMSEIHDTLSILGTNLSPAAVSLILAKGYKEALIFLDADNPTVRSEARRIAKKLPFLPVRLIEPGRDPKLFTKEQLQVLTSK